MIPVQRRQRIKDYVQRQDLVLLPDLVLELGISESTLRRDLREMERAGEVDLLRGGGVKLRHAAQEIGIDSKLNRFTDEKERIAAYAASLVYPGDILFLDPSSISYLMIGHLTMERLLVITNSVMHISKMVQVGVECILVGGHVRHGLCSCFGPYAERMMRSLRFTKSFLGANGLSLTMGLTTHDPGASLIKQLAMEQSVSTYFLVDSGKYGVVAMCKTADITDCPIIVDRYDPDFAAHPNIHCLEGPPGAAPS